MKTKKVVKSTQSISPVPSKEMQKAFDLFPKLIKHKEKVAREKNRIKKNFESVRHKLFKK